MCKWCGKLSNLHAPGSDRHLLRRAGCLWWVGGYTIGPSVDDSILLRLVWSIPNLRRSICCSEWWLWELRTWLLCHPTHLERPKSDELLSVEAVGKGTLAVDQLLPEIGIGGALFGCAPLPHQSACGSACATSGGSYLPLVRLHRAIPQCLEFTVDLLGSSPMLELYGTQAMA